MIFDHNKLRGRIVEKFGSQVNFAMQIGRSDRTLSLKMNNKVPITVEDIVEWRRPENLDIPVNEIGLYFFTQKVKEL